MSLHPCTDHAGRNRDESVERRMTLYTIAAAAAGVSVLALAAPASGEVVVTKTHLVAGTTYGQSTALIDLNKDGVDDFQIQLSFGGYDHSFWCSLAITPLTGGEVMGGNRGPMFAYASALVRGANIGPSAHFSSSAAQGQLTIERSVGFASAGTSYKDYGQWGAVGNNRYLGVKFLIDGQTHYGWIRLAVDNADRNSGTITAFAYETVANKKLKAGESASSDDAQAQTTREPGRPALGMLALGADGMELWCRD